MSLPDEEFMQEDEDNPFLSDFDEDENFDLMNDEEQQLFPEED